MAPASTRSRKKTWSPGSLGVGILVGLAITLSLFLVGINVLWYFAKRSQLYQSAFLYQMDIRPSTRYLGQFSPFSILPTFIASIISLWWDSVQEQACTLQPFITLTQPKGTKYSQGIGLHYCPSNWTKSLWTAWKNRHWLLSATIIGSILCQIRESITSAIHPSTVTPNL